MPFMEDTSKEMFSQLGIIADELKTWESIKKNQDLDNIKVIEKGEPLFMRLDTNEEIEYIKNAMRI